MSRRPSRAVPQAIRRAVATVTEALEPRQLFAATVIQPLANTFGDPGTTSGAIDLAASFQDPAAGVVRLTTPSGTIDIKTFDQDAPLNAAQFVGIANSGKYNGTYFHRAVISPTPFVLQGGSFYTDDTEVSGVSPVKSEPNGDRHNVRGTVAFARVPATDQSGQPIPGGGPDSATSGFFFNLSDNSANLDNQNGGFTVLGQVLGNGMQVVDALAAIPDGQAKTSRLITTAAQVPDLTFNVSSTNPTLVNPQLAGNSLVLQYGSGTGSAQVTVTATDVDGNMVMSTFTAGVGQLDITVGGPGGAKAVNFADADGTASTVSLKGAGAANVRLTGMGLAQTNNKGVVTVSGASILLNSVGVTGSKGSTAVTITGAGGGDGVVALGGLTTDGPARSVVARGVNLTGSLTTGGALRMLDLGASNLATITLGGAATGGATAISIGSATDTNILSNLNIKSLKGNTFVSTGNTFGLITAPAMGTITMTGNFAEDVALSGRIKSMKIGGNLTGEIIADGIGAVNVVGNLDNARLNLTATPGGRALASLKVAGGINNSTIRSNAGIGPITAVSMNGATIFAGVNSGVTTLPTTAADFADVAATITSVKVATIFANSNIAARNLGKMMLGTVQLTNGGVPFGLAADKIAAVTGQTGPGLTFNLKKLDTPEDVTQQAPGLNLMDARITLV